MIPSSLCRSACLAITLAGAWAPALLLSQSSDLDREIANAPKAIALEARSQKPSGGLGKRSVGKRGVDDGGLSPFGADGPVENLDRWGSPYVFSAKIQVGAAQRYYDGLDSLSIESLRDDYRLLPNHVDFRRVYTTFGWNPRDTDEILFTIPLVQSEGVLEAEDGTSGQFEEIGIGDIAVDYVRTFHSDRQHRTSARVGLLLPNADYTEQVRMSDGTLERLPYGLQTGRGHFEGRVGIAHERTLSEVSIAGGSIWGSHPLQNNSLGYQWGASAGARVFYERKVMEWLTVRTRLTGRVSDKIRGFDPQLNPLDSPVHDPESYGNLSLEFGVDFTYFFASDPYKSRYITWGQDVAIYRDTSGIQLVEEYFTTLGFGWRF